MNMFFGIYSVHPRLFASLRLWLLLLSAKSYWWEISNEVSHAC